MIMTRQTYDVYHAPLLLPIRAFPRHRTSRSALSASLFPVRQKRDGDILRSLCLRRRVIVVSQRVRVVTRTRDGLRRRQRRLLRLGFPMRFLLEQGHFAREYVESLLLRLRDERALVDRQLRIVDEWIRQVVVLRPQVLFLLLNAA